MKLFLACGLCIAAFAPAKAEDWLHAGPLYDHFALTLSPGQRTEIAGPLFYWDEQETGTTWGVPPLFTHHTDPGTDSEEFDVGYPVLTYDRYGAEYRWQLFQMLSLSGGQNQAEQGTRRFTLFPLYFQQRSAESNQNYTAFIPFYGHLKKRLLRDEIFFVMFPIYSVTRKKDVVTHNYLYPIFDVRRGDNLRGWQVWPLFGTEEKGITSATNGFGDVSLIPGHDSRFVLWPFYMQSHNGVGTDNPERQWAILPFYYSVRSPKRDSSTAAWPFFTHVTDREKNYREWETPWPLVVFARGEGKTTSRIWPFFSHAQSTNLESRFYLWPVYKFNALRAPNVERERTRILFFLYSDTTQKNLATGADQRRVDFWPFFTYRRDYDGRSRLQCLSVVEPFVPQSKSIERNYSPVWALWRSEKNPVTEAASQSLLWNLYRHETVKDSKKCSLLFGLFQYESGPGGKRMRLFYVPVLKTAANQPPQ